MSFTNINTAILTVHCEDEKGIISYITNFIQHNNGNIVELDQHVDVDANRFFMRLEWEMTHFSIPRDKVVDYIQTLIASRYNDVHWDVSFSEEKSKIAIFVSHYGHCLYDLLARYETKEWDVEIPVVISNHKEFQAVVERMGIRFEYFDITSKNKVSQEEAQLALLKELDIDTIILARYMQILSPMFVKSFRNKIINIHHSSLPAFPGANPYKNAFNRGVKFMGATAHYVTDELDEGPIIAQDVIPISHRHTLEDLKRRGRDIEKIVLAKAVYAHISKSILTFNNKTVVFD
jgi:formyltetrahydrofolate deformylase